MTNMITPGVGEELEQSERLHTAGMNVKWQNHFRRGFRVFLES